MLLINVDIYKDIFDLIWGWGGLLGAIAIPIMVWYFGSSRAEKIKNKKQQVEALNYLAISSNRYLKYILGLYSLEEVTRNQMQVFLQNPNEFTKMVAFQEMIPPMINFEVKLQNYAFTVENEPILLDLLLKFMQFFEDVMVNINYMNSDMNLIHKPDIPLEKFQQIADGYLRKNLDTWLFKIHMCSYVLCRLIYEIKNYEKYLSNETILCIDYSDEIKQHLENAVRYLNTVIGNDIWQNDFQKSENFNSNKTFKYRLEFFLQKFFSIKNIERHKVLTILGLKIKWLNKRKIEDTNYINFQQILKQNNYQSQLLQVLLNTYGSMNQAVNNVWIKVDEIKKNMDKEDNTEDKKNRIL